MQKHQRFSSRWKKSWWQKLDYERFQTSNLHHFYHMPSIKEIPTGWKLYVCCPWSARMEKRRVQSELPNVQAYGEQKVFNGRNFVHISFSWRGMAVHLQTLPSQTCWLLKSVSLLRWWSFFLTQSHPFGPDTSAGRQDHRASAEQHPVGEPCNSSRLSLGIDRLHFGESTLESGCFHSSWRRW